MDILNSSAFEYEVVTVDGQGNLKQRQTCQAECRTEPLGDELSLELVKIPGGQFLMGSPQEEGHHWERPQHLVTVEAFWMGKFLVTQAQWEKVASFAKVNRNLKSRPSNFKGDTLPVGPVTWYEAIEFCRQLSKKTGVEYRLPSEAEWEYACRAGTTTPFHFGETIAPDLANYHGIDLTPEPTLSGPITLSGSYGEGPKGGYREKTTPVGCFKAANAFGLYDMHGNMREWCLDHWHDNYEGAPTDGSAWISPGEGNNRLIRWLFSNSNKNRIVRGGAFFDDPDSCRSASRKSFYPNDPYNLLGFRVCCSLFRTCE
ncbi:MAG: formylglycine-generating enzyme family protein [Leptolyngbyaceae cyanobacterium MO_188.B28]|nr:formylglycine-generating enzyme family protein [Leptolyngbyaceae cyanobacterium MO_188.B28]